VYGYTEPGEVCPIGRVGFTAGVFRCWQQHLWCGDNLSINQPHFNPAEELSMLSLSQSPFSLFERLDQQLQHAERAPVAEIRESDEGYELAVELPGIPKDAIDIKASENAVMVSAERSESPGGHERVLSEFRYGPWRRAFYFGKRIDPNKLEAELQDGVLQITAPKVDSVRAVTIKVSN